MVDWLSSMEQTFEYYEVDPNTWRDTKLLRCVKSSSITRDLETDTLGSATIDANELLGEAYIRIYLVTIQNGRKERHPLGTFLVQTPSSTHDGLVRSVSLDAYTPLIELKENYPDMGYFVPKGSNVMDYVYRLTTENMRAPVIKPSSDETLYDDFISDPEEKWLSFNSALMNNAKHTYGLDDMGRVIFVPKRDIKAMQPVWTFNDDNSSILHHSVTTQHDLFGIPNVVEVIYSHGAGSFYARVENNDPSSPTSIQARGRRITRRVTDLNMIGNPTNQMIDDYAKQLLEELSSVAYTVTYTHAYCPVRLGDCVRLNYTRAGLQDVKCKVISQSIQCEPGCPVTETAIYQAKLWEGGN